jgi:hypothetical protein
LQCARERLAQLLVDVVGNRPGPDWNDCEKVVQEHLMVFEVHFWKATASNLWRVLREWRQANAGGLS